MSEDDEALNLTADLSDISDAEESTTNIMHAEQFKQRLVSREHHRDTEADNNSSDCNSLSVDTNYTLGSCKTKTSSSTSGPTDEVTSRDQSHDNTTSCSSAPQPRPKIWSISEIISSQNDTDSQKYTNRHFD